MLGHPAVAVAWLANAVAQFGVGLSAGDIIMPGALCGAVEVGAGDLLQASFDGLGTVSVRFAWRKPMEQIRAVFLGSGNIGTDLMYKLKRRNSFGQLTA